MTIKTSSLGGGGSLSRLAPDLNFIADKTSNGYTAINFDPSSGLTTALSLTGKFAIPFMRIENITSESFTIKLTINSVVIWNRSRVMTATDEYLTGSSNAAWADIPFSCNTSLLFEVQTTSDSSVDLFYTARPIL